MWICFCSKTPSFFFSVKTVVYIEKVSVFVLQYSRICNWNFSYYTILLSEENFPMPHLPLQSFSSIPLIERFKIGRCCVECYGGRGRLGLFQFTWMCTISLPSMDMLTGLALVLTILGFKVCVLPDLLFLDLSVYLWYRFNWYLALKYKIWFSQELMQKFVICVCARARVWSSYLWFWVSLS